MSWSPISRARLDELIREELSECDETQQLLFEKTRIEPTKWSQHPWGDEGGGFWAVAVLEDFVLWYNDIEEGWNRSQFTTRGEIPDSEYWCNQDPLKWVLSSDPEYVRRITSS